jgi:hypothetical protein
MPFDVLQGCLNLLGLSDRYIRQLEWNDEFMHLRFRNPQIAWLFFPLRELFGKPASRAALRHMYKDANPKVISKALRRGLVDPGHQEKGTEATPQKEAKIVSWIEEKSAREEHVSQTDILHYVRDKYSPALTQGWVNCFSCAIETRCVVISPACKNCPVFK